MTDESSILTALMVMFPALSSSLDVEENPEDKETLPEIDSQSPSEATTHPDSE